MAARQSNWDVKQAMLASLELLEDVEQQVKQSIGLAENVSISDISEEQLQLVPAELLSALDAAMTVVQQLRQQLPLSDSDKFEGGSSNEADDVTVVDYARAASTAPRINSPSSIIFSKDRQYLPVRPASAPKARPHCGATYSSPGSCPLQRSLQNSGSKAAASFCSERARLSPSRSPANGNSSARHVEAARSSLFSKLASQEATELWLAGKVQQQQNAVTAYERDLHKERQQLAKLQERQSAAAQAHEQVQLRSQHLPLHLSCPDLDRMQAMQDIQGLVQLTNTIQALVTAEEQWKGYLGTIRDRLQT